MRPKEVMQALQQVKDEGLQTDIVSSGFVGAIKADRVTGNISLVLEARFWGFGGHHPHRAPPP